MKKIVSIFLSILLIFSLVGCSQSKENTSSPDEIASYNTDIESAKIQFGLDGNNGEYLEFTLPYTMKDYCIPTYSSDFDEGWVKITVGATDANNRLFTVYASTNESYKQLEKEKNYRILGTDGVYTVIWYEYDLSDNLTDEVKIIVSEMEKNYNLIQESVTIKIPATQ